MKIAIRILLGAVVLGAGWFVMNLSGFLPSGGTNSKNTDSGPRSTTQAQHADTPAIPDAAPVDIAALVTTSDQIKLDPPRPPRAVVDHRGWIDAWELQRDVIQVESMPRDYGDRCIPEGDGEMEQEMPKLSAEEKQKREQARIKAKALEEKCLAENARAGAEFARASAALNEAWLPALKDAMRKGDPVAEVILRTCDTSSVIDRSGIETDCSGDEAIKEVARQRLEAIGFTPALHMLNIEDTRRMLYFRALPKPARPWKGRGPHSDAPQVALGERLIDTLEKGDMNAAASLPGAYCGNEPESAHKRCLYLYHMTSAIPAQARWFFIAGRILGNDHSGTLTKLALYRRRPNPEQPFRVLYEEQYPKNWAPRVVENSTEFLKEHTARMATLDANIAAYLKKEPRWAVFLMERRGNELRFAVPPTEKAAN